VREQVDQNVKEKN